MDTEHAVEPHASLIVAKRNSLSARDWLRGYSAMVVYGLGATLAIFALPTLPVPSSMPVWIMMVGVYAGPAWVLGVAVVGIPAWWVLHRLGVRDLVSAIAAGALLTAAAGGGLAVLTSRATAQPPMERSSAWINGRQTVADGQLTDYGRQRRDQGRLWFPLIAAGLGALAGASSGFGLWRTVYRR